MSEWYYDHANSQKVQHRVRQLAHAMDDHEVDCDYPCMLALVWQAALFAQSRGQSRKEFLLECGDMWDYAIDQEIPTLPDFGDDNDDAY